MLHYAICCACIVWYGGGAAAALLLFSVLSVLVPQTDSALSLFVMALSYRSIAALRPAAIHPALYLAVWGALQGCIVPTTSEYTQLC